MQIVLGGAVLLQLSVLPGAAGDPAPRAPHRGGGAGLGRRLYSGGGAHLGGRPRGPVTAAAPHVLGRPAPARRSARAGPAARRRRRAHRFHAGGTNQAALEAVLSWPDWPAHACLLIGPAACGKTHLARVWAERAGAGVLPGSDLWAPAEPLAGSATRLPASWTMRTRCCTRSSCSISGIGWWTGRQPAAHRVLAGRGLERGLPDLRSRLLTAWPVQSARPTRALAARSGQAARRPADPHGAGGRGVPGPPHGALVRRRPAACPRARPGLAAGTPPGHHAARARRSRRTRR